MIFYDNGALEGGEDLAFQISRTPIGAGDYQKRLLENATLPTGAETFDPTQGVLNITVEQVNQF